MYNKGIVIFTLSQPGNVFSETSDQHKIVNAMIVDHRNMWRRIQTLTYIVSYSGNKDMLILLCQIKLVNWATTKQ